MLVSAIYHIDFSHYSKFVPLKSSYVLYIRVVRCRLLITIFLLILSYEDSFGQKFPDLTGDELLEAVVEEYKPNFVETYSQARVLMYRDIYNVNDSVQTLYSGHSLYLPPQEEFPIQFLAQDGQADGINAEHIYPRSKGASEENGNAFSDLHNLTPARWAVNEARSNFPFGDVDDVDSDCWFYKTRKVDGADRSAITDPSQFAELDRIASNFGIFEPREEAKGDIARSVFYFYTMYREEAIEADSDFFDDMREDLCTWHNEDAVSEEEMDRNIMKAFVQDGKANPFIMDCGLANRLYCPEFDPTTCENITTAIDDSLVSGEEITPSIKIYPNPNSGIFTLDISSINPGPYKVDIYFLSGTLIYSLQEELDYFNSINMWNAKPGLHIIHLTHLETKRKYSGLFEVVK